MRKLKPCIIKKGKEEKYCESLADAAFHIGVTRQSVVKALQENRAVKGWTVEEDRRIKGKTYTKEQKFEFVSIRVGKTEIRYKEIFTRKPYSATGIWEGKK